MTDIEVAEKALTEIAGEVLDAWTTAEMLKEQLEKDDGSGRPYILTKCLIDQLRTLRYSLTGET